MQVNSWLDEKECRELCMEFGLEFEKTQEKPLESIYSQEKMKALKQDGKTWIQKPPVVAVMGHVNHGKTTLLDTLRKTNISQQEYGNITQHISSYQIRFQGNEITFLDTPGHEIFSKLRSIGGIIADIIVLVIALDDGIQAQTLEIIEYFRAFQLKMIVFANKADKAISNLENLKKQLNESGVLLEEYGGEVMIIPGSAKTGQGVQELLEGINLIAQIEEYSTILEPPAIGVILESKIDRGLGSISEVLTISGEINIGDYISGEEIFCKVKTIIDSNNQKLKSLKPSIPASISGFIKPAKPGNKFFSFKSKKEAWEYYSKLDKNITNHPQLSHSSKDSPTFIIKSRVIGSSEAIKLFLSKFNYPVVYFGSGEIVDYDLKEAQVRASIIINFEQKISKHISEEAQFLNLTIWSINSIYELEEKIVEYREKNRKIEKIEKVLGRCRVIRLWSHSKIGTIAGCSVISGKISIEHKIRLIREGNLLTKTNIKSFKIENFEIKLAVEGQECGIILNNWNNIELDDILESYEIIERKS